MGVAQRSRTQLVPSSKQGSRSKRLASLAAYQSRTLIQLKIMEAKLFIQFSMHFSATETEGTQAPTQLLFFDERRHARIWLASSPLDKPPISELGFDPILLMPKFEDFKKVVLRRTCPAITLLVDQRFIARIGNWVAGAPASRSPQNHCDAYWPGRRNIVSGKDSSRTAREHVIRGPN